MDDETIQQSAKVLERALRSMAEDGQKVLSVTYHYPRGWRAWEVGFAFTSGAIGAASLAVLLAVAVSKVLS